MLRATSARVFYPECNAPVSQAPQTFHRQRGPQPVSEKPFAPHIVAGGDVHPRVEIEPLVLRAEALVG
jgi:hypothetical protein